MILLMFPKSLYKEKYGGLAVSALEELKQEIEYSQKIRKQNLVELKNSYSFEVEGSPKLRNVLFQELMKKHISEPTQKTRK